MNRVKAISTILLAIVAHTTFAQNIHIIDAENKRPVADVLVFDEPFTHSVVTNRAGKAPLDKFEFSHRIIIQHPAYRNVVSSLKELKQKNYQLIFQPSNLQLGEVTVSANKWEQDIDEVPNQIAIIPKRDIEFTNPQTSADLLNNTGLVYVQKSQLGGGSPMIRGFAANAVLLVVDGVRMNNAIFRGGNLQNVISIDPNFVENSEVIFGPGSIIYGSDALGGVMDFHTLRPELTTTDTFKVSGSAMMRYATANNENTLHLSINGGSNKWAFRTAATYSKFNDLKMGSNGGENSYHRNFYVERVNGRDSIFRSDNPYLQEQSGYEQMNLMQKVRFRPGKHLDITYGLHISTTTDIPRYDRLIEFDNDDNINDTLKYAEWYYGPQEWIMNNVQLKYAQKTSIFDQVKLIMAHQLFKESRHKRKFNNTSKGEQFEKVNAYTINLDAEKRIGRHELFYGAEYLFNDVKSTAHDKNILDMTLTPDQSRYPDGTNHYHTIATYASYKHVIGKEFYGTAGLRYSHIMLSSNVSNNLMNLPETDYSLNTGSLTGALGLVKMFPAQQFRIAANVSSGFRAPNLDDIAKVFDSEPGTVIVPNNNLNPEYAYNADLTLHKEFGNTAFLRLTGFYTYLDDAIVRRAFTINDQDSIQYDGVLSGVKANINAGNALIYGVSADAQLALSRNLRLKGSITWTDGEDNDGEPLRHASPLFGSTHIIFEKKDVKADLYLNFNGEISYENLAPSEKDKPHLYATNDDGNPYSPAWQTVNFRVSYQLNEQLILNAGVENIFDQMYRPYSSGIVAPGRNIVISGKYIF
jgi:hemoglobin/transferrin/lactoferrin receptor protein